MTINVARSRRIQILLKVLILIFAAFFCSFLLEYRARQNNAGATFSWIAGAPLVFLYSAVIMFFILLLAYGILRKTFLSIGIVAAAILVIGYIDITKYSFRGAPVLPEDFALSDQAGTLTKFVDVGDIIRLVIAVLLTLALAILLDYLTKKPLQREPAPKTNKWWRRYVVMSRIAIAAVAIVGLAATTGFIRHHPEDESQRISFLKTDFIAWSQVMNYNTNGFLIGFIYNLNSEKFSQPGDYSEKRIDEIASQVEKSKSNDKTRKSLKDFDANIILVLDESFYDPAIIKEYYNYTGGDVTPNLHKLQKKYPHGAMYSPEYGGGTANIEYEILTGLTNYWLDSTPFTSLLSKKSTVPSIASFASDNGYYSMMIHPFSSAMYKRNIVLPSMGFKELITKDGGFQHAEKDGESDYVNDRSAYLETLDKLKETDKNALISLITMQNHAPYIKDEYGESKFKVTNVDDAEERDSIETYLMTLHNSDKYLGEFFEQLDKFEEKTVVLFYGDHSAGVFPKLIESKVKEERDLAHQTPYLIYANFDLGVAEQSLPTTTPNCLANTMFNLLGVEKPSVGYLLDKVCAQAPILARPYYEDKSPFASTEMSAYKLLTYDIVAGNQWSLAALGK